MQVKLFPYFTYHYLITHIILLTDLVFCCIVYFLTSTIANKSCSFNKVLIKFILIHVCTYSWT